MMNTPGLRARAYLLITKEALQKLFVLLERRCVHRGRNAACLSHRLLVGVCNKLFLFKANGSIAIKRTFSEINCRPNILFV